MKTLTNYIQESKESNSTVKDFVNDNLNHKSLIMAVYNQMGFDDEYFFSSLKDVSNSGADGGFNGFIYYKDTVKFFDDNKGIIKKYAIEQAEDFGNTDYAEMVTTFNDFKHSDYNVYDVYDVFGDYVNWEEAEEYDGATEKDEEELTQLKNLLAWYALEEVAHLYEYWTES